MKKNILFGIMVFIILFLSCTTQFSPWEADPDGYDCPKNLTEKNIERILKHWENKTVKDSLVIALISDSHLWYDKLENAFRDLVKGVDIDLLIYGHTHVFHPPEEIYNNGVLYFGADCLESKTFTKITIYPKGGTNEPINFKYENIEF